MSISEEKFEKLLTVLQETLEDQRRMHADNHAIQKEMLEMLKEKIRDQKKENESDSEKFNTSQDLNSNSSMVGGERKPKFSMAKPKPIRPKLETELDDIGWRIFLDKWAHYKSIADILDEKEKCMELRECCSSEVTRLLYQYYGSIDVDTLNEGQMLANIKSVAVNTTHPHVHRWHYTQLNQMDGEPVTKYVARLRSQAGLCDYVVDCRCGTHVSYADEMIAQKLITGLVNPDHQSRILSESNDCKTLDEKITRLISLETTDDAMLKVRSTTRVNAARSSQYKRDQKSSGRSPSPMQKRGRSRERNFQSDSKKRRCRGCGRYNHSGKPLKRQECPAYNEECRGCGEKGHFEKVCEKRSSRASYAKRVDDTSCSDYSDLSDTEMSASENEQIDVDGKTIGVHYAAKSVDFRNARRKRSQR